ncbi:hypothetical protein ASB57_11850 [Bordetella sp. N]|nr:hypothetical protein ASB57_11850 [Bordetella sp. N]
MKPSFGFTNRLAIGDHGHSRSQSIRMREKYSICVNDIIQCVVSASPEFAKRFFHVESSHLD